MAYVGTFLRTWDQFVTLGALFALVALALRIMVRNVEFPAALTQLAMVLACTVLLLELPSIIVGIWLTLSFWQHLGLAALLGIIVLAFLGTCRNRQTTRGAGVRRDR